MRTIALSTTLIVATVIAQADTLMDENFNGPLGPQWTSVDSGGPANLTVGGGVAALGPLDSGSAVSGESAYIQQVYDNSTTNYGGYTVSFEVDFTGLSFTPDTTQGNNDVELFTIMPTSGNAAMVQLAFWQREWNNDYWISSTNGVQYSSTGNVRGDHSFSVSALESYSRLGFSGDITFVNNGGLNWTVASTWTLTDLTDSSFVAEFTSTITRDATNTSFDPTTGSNEKFQLGLTGYGLQFTAPNFTGGITFDNFLVTAVPEPASLGLLALGAVALLRRRRMG